MENWYIHTLPKIVVVDNSIEFIGISLEEATLQLSKHIKHPESGKYV